MRVARVIQGRLFSQVKITGIWKRGTLQLKCPDEATCFETAKLPSRDSLRAMAEKKLHKEFENRVVTPRKFLDAISKSKDEMSYCLLAGEIEENKVNRDTALLYYDDLINISISLLANPKSTYQITDDCDRRIKDHGEKFSDKFPEYTPVGLTEFRVNIGGLEGQKVKIRSLLTHSGNIFMLKASETEMPFALVDMKEIKRIDLLKFMNKCPQQIPIGCAVDISGEIKTTHANELLPSLLAKEISLMQ